MHRILNLTEKTMTYIKSLLPKVNNYRWWLGILLTALIAGAATYISDTAWMHKLGLSTLTIAIILGIILGNTCFKFVAPACGIGVDYSKNLLLRLGIILYGFRITFQQIYNIGWQGVVLDIIVVSVIFCSGFYMGYKLFRLDKKTAALIGAGSAICGAAAVMATEPVVRAQAHKVSLAVATVVIFGTLSMFLYPLCFPYLQMSEVQYGIYTGATIHEVAQVVAAGNAVSETATATAVIVKMFRVMLLVPFLLILSATFKLKAANKQSGCLKSIPWFAIMFIVASGINSLQIIPAEHIKTIEIVSTYLLAMAMSALGLRTHIGAIRQAGVKPLFLAFILFGILITLGYVLTQILIK